VVGVGLTHPLVLSVDPKHNKQILMLQMQLVEWLMLWIKQQMLFKALE
jgi:hypothetical protein